MHAAKFLQIPLLADRAMEAMRSRVAPSNALATRRVAALYDYKDIAAVALRTASRHLASIAASEEWFS